MKQFRSIPRDRADSDLMERKTSCGKSNDHLSFRPMRPHLLILLIPLVLSCCGCSVFIARSGFDVGTLSSREQIQEKFGSPVSTETIDGHFQETYVTRRKLSEDFRSYGMGMGVVMTFGTGELLSFPYELYLLGRRTIFGQKLHALYDPAGRFSHIIVENNGDFLYGGGEFIGPQRTEASANTEREYQPLADLVEED